MTAWNEGGFPAHRIVVAIAAYGETFTLESAFSSDLGADITGAGPAGSTTGQTGMLAYYEVNTNNLEWN